MPFVHTLAASDEARFRVIDTARLPASGRAPMLMQ